MDFSHASQAVLLLSVALIAFAESLAVVGLLVPGIALLVSITIVAVDSGVSPWLWWAAGTLGAFSGDGLSFWLGQKAGPGIRRWRYFGRHPRVLADGEAFFLRYGVWSIVVGRFIGPLRPVVPLAAGALEMSPARFWIANLVSSPLWGAVYLAGMYWLGEEFMNYLSPGRMFLMLLLATVVALLVSLVARRRHSP